MKYNCIFVPFIILLVITPEILFSNSENITKDTIKIKDKIKLLNYNGGKLKTPSYDLLVNNKEEFIIVEEDKLVKYNSTGKYSEIIKKINDAWFTFFAFNSGDSLYFMNCENESSIACIDISKKSISQIQYLIEDNYFDNGKLKFFDNKLFHISFLQDSLNFNNEVKPYLNSIDLNDFKSEKIQLPLIDFGWDFEFYDFWINSNILFLSTMGDSYLISRQNNNNIIDLPKDLNIDEFICSINNKLLFLEYKNNIAYLILLNKDFQINKTILLGYNTDNLNSNLKVEGDDWDQRSAYYIRNKGYLPFCYNEYLQTLYFLVNDKKGVFIWKIKMSDLFNE